MYNWWFGYITGGLGLVYNWWIGCVTGGLGV